MVRYIPRFFVFIALAAFGVAGSPAAFAADAAKLQRCITVLYPSGADIHFDFDYYLKNHATMIRKLYGKGITKLELRRGVTAQDGSKPPYVAVVSIWIGSQEVFDAAQQKYASRLIADVPNFTNGKPIIQVDEVMR